MKDSELIEILDKIEKDLGVIFTLDPAQDVYKKDEIQIIFSNVWDKDSKLIKSLKKIESNTDVKFKIEPDDGFLEPDELLVIASNVWEDEFLLKMLDALIDTAQRTTELDNVYNDKNNTSISWSEIYKFQNQLKAHQ